MGQNEDLPNWQSQIYDVNKSEAQERVTNTASQCHDFEKSQTFSIRESTCTNQLMMTAELQQVGEEFDELRNSELSLRSRPSHLLDGFQINEEGRATQSPEDLCKADDNSKPLQSPRPFIENSPL